MITRIPFYLFVTTTFLCHQAACLQSVNSSSRRISPTTATASSTSLNYATVADEQTLEKDATDSLQNSILNTYPREDPQVSVAQLLTEQVAREFTTGRRYLLAASAVKELSEDFYDVEEQQRVRAVELMDFARTHDIEILDYASQVDKTPIDKSMETTDLLEELRVQEQKDEKLLEQVMAQVGSKNVQLFAFLETIRASQIERKAQIMQSLSDALPSLQNTAVDTAASVATAQVSSGDFSLQDLLSKFENTDHLPSSVSRWADNQLQGFGHHIHDIFTITGATVATVAVVDAVDPESFPTTDDLLQAVDTATALLDQQNLMNTEALAQIVDVVSGLY